MSKRGDRALKRFPELLPQYANNVAETCRKLKMSRAWFTATYAKNKEFREKIDEVTEAQIDHVECKLQEQIDEGNVQAIMFFLKSKAKHRGYVEKELESGVTQNFRIMIDDVKQISEGEEREITIRG